LCASEGRFPALWWARGQGGSSRVPA
jgi:hypothetical protein